MNFVTSFFKVFFSFSTDRYNHRFFPVCFDFSFGLLDDVGVETSAQACAAGNNDIASGSDFSVTFQIMLRNITAVMENFSNGVCYIMKILVGLFKGGFGFTELTGGYQFHGICDMLCACYTFDTPFDILHAACCHSFTSFTLISFKRSV
jgi:hypothetical protein